jgi:hypothetical protein
VQGVDPYAPDDPASNQTTTTTTKYPVVGPPPRDQFTPYERGSSNTAYDQAVAIVEHFLQIMGWPAGLDSQALELGLLQQGLELSDERSYNWLFSQLSESLQKANPNAEFGMTEDAYVSQLNALRDSFEYFTGNPDIPNDVLRMAIDQGWTQQEMMTFLQHDKRYSDPARLPWLSAGLGYRDVRNQFYQTYGKNPTGVEQLSSWYQFKTGAQSVAGGPPATIQAGVGPQKNLPSQSEIR